MEINKLHHADCLLTLSKTEDKFFDMTITSPPYNVGGGSSEKYVGGYEDKRSDEEYFSWLCRIIDELLRTNKKHIFFNIQMLSNNKDVVMELMYKYKHNLKDIIIWNKRQGIPNGGGVMSSMFEFIFIFSNVTPRTRQFYDANIVGGFFNVINGRSAAHENNYSDIHKATMPLYIPMTILQKFGQEGEIIYDPFGGTGTTAVASIKSKRNWVLSEINPQYVKVINDRLNNVNNEKELDFV